MREIKFRAWDKKEKKMCEVIQINWVRPMIIINFPTKKGSWIVPTPMPWKEIKLMQFTGLKDKHGREIYEGDILQIFINGYPKKGVIIFDETRAQFGFNTEVENESSNHVVLHDKPEVIGNMWENPELLK